MQHFVGICFRVVRVFTKIPDKIQVKSAVSEYDDTSDESSLFVSAELDRINFWRVSLWVMLSNGCRETNVLGNILHEYLVRIIELLMT